MTTVTTLLLLVALTYALTRYARHDGLAAPTQRPESRDERDHIRPDYAFG